MPVSARCSSLTLCQWNQIQLAHDDTSLIVIVAGL